MERFYLYCSNGYTLSVEDGAIKIYSVRSTEIVPISAIQSFSIQRPGLIYGKIIFATAQANTASVHIGAGVSVGIGGEYTFFYKKDDYAKAERMCELVTNWKSKSVELVLPEQQVASLAFGSAQSTPAAPVNPTKPAQPNESCSEISVTDELRTLKELLDEGVITREEFNAKKQQLMNL